MGTAAISDGDYVHVAIEHADLIIMVGHDVVEKPPFFMHPKDTRKVRPLTRIDTAHLIFMIGRTVMRKLAIVMHPKGKQDGSLTCE